jgi:hypothetical protein
MSTNYIHPLHCRLIVVPLDDFVPEYEALSYYWGDARDQVSITCSDETQTRRHNITRSLYNALSVLRSRRDRHARYFWADGICMNQTPEAKNVQVPLMVRIYQRATRVVIWLGEEQSETGPAVSAIARCSNAIFTMPTASVMTMPDMAWTTLGFQHGKEAKYQIRAFYKLMTRPWMGRMWCIQEFATAKSLIFLCGHYEIAEDKIMNASAWLETSSASMVAPWGSNPLFLLQNLRSELRCQLKQPLMTLLASWRHRNATWSQDKIYAVYKMAADGGVDGLNIEPDYVNTTKEQAFKQLAVSFFRCKRNLDTLSLAGIYEPRESDPAMFPGLQQYEVCHGLPSWVPNWCSADSTISVASYELQRPAPARDATNVPHYTFPAETPPTVFKAAGDSFYEYMPVNENGLQVQGLTIGTVARLGLFSLDAHHVPDQQSWHIEPSIQVQMDRVFSELGRIANWMDLIGAESNKVYFAGEPMMEVFWQTMRLGHFPHGFFRERQEFVEWYNVIRPMFNTARMFRSGKHKLLRNAMTTLYNSYCHANGMTPKTSFSVRTSSVTANRAMFVTQNGLVGMAVRGANLGDRIVLLGGCCVPMILRPRSDGCWVVVGACYVHGVMDGKMWDEGRCVDMVLV